MTPGADTLRDYPALVERAQRLRVCRDPSAAEATMYLDQYEGELAALLDLGLRERVRLRGTDERDRDARTLAHGERYPESEAAHG